MNAYVVFVFCAGASAIAAGVGAKAQPSDNERYMGAAMAVFFGLAAIVLPIVIVLQSSRRPEPPPATRP